MICFYTGCFTLGLFFFCPMTRLWVVALREGRRRRRHCKFSFWILSFCRTYCGLPYVVYDAHLPWLITLYSLLFCLHEFRIYFTREPQLPWRLSTLNLPPHSIQFVSNSLKKKKAYWRPFTALTLSNNWSHTAALEHTFFFLKRL